MDLREFVTQTLVQIVEGVSQAKSQLSTTGASVNPLLIGDYREMAKHGGGLMLEAGGFAQLVEFDVALTITEATGTKGGIGVFAGAITLGSSGQSQQQNSSVSRVKFNVPMKLPDA
ncbi:MAG: hypothetical protein JWO52_2429 [Gammaproteobacteria bacterium]|jgi:hypothetical protein|nr:hypothetical protein [Gammaproteobacteria bacterium]